MHSFQFDKQFSLRLLIISSNSKLVQASQIALHNALKFKQEAQHKTLKTQQDRGHYIIKDVFF